MPSYYPENNAPRESDEEPRVSHKILGTLQAGAGTLSSVTSTRPADTTAYTAGDVVGGASSGILEFTNVGLAGAMVMIVAADLRIDVSAVPSGMGNQRLHLYTAAPDAIADNAAWDLASSGDRGKYVGFIDLGTPVDLGSTLFVAADGVNKAVKLADGSTSLFGIRQTIAAYTPTSAAVSTIRLRSVPL